MTTPKMLTRDDILSANDIATEVVHVPEWGGSVIVRALTAHARDQYEAQIMEMDNKGKLKQWHLDRVRTTLAALTIVDESGKRLFSDADVVNLGKKSAAALARVVEVAQRLSGIRPEDVEALEDGVKNDLPGASPSD